MAFTCMLSQHVCHHHTQTGNLLPDPQVAKAILVLMTTTERLIFISEYDTTMVKCTKEKKEKKIVELDLMYVKSEKTTIVGFNVIFCSMKGTKNIPDLNRYR